MKSVKQEIYSNLLSCVNSDPSITISASGRLQVWDQIVHSALLQIFAHTINQIKSITHVL